MSAKIVCYAQPDKRKSQVVLEAFAAGAGAKMASTTARTLEPGAAVFYGIRPPWKHLWEQAVAENRPRYYIDNSYLDAAREKQFRVGVNGLQSWSVAATDGQRLARLGVAVLPWSERKDGAIYICPQSAEFMQTHFSTMTWQDDVCREVEKHTRRPAILRMKRDSEPFSDVLKRSWLIVAHSSSAAVEALIAGVPVIVTDPRCACAQFGSAFEQVENPRRPDGREAWAKRLADSQWSLDEFRSGAAWAAING